MGGDVENGLLGISDEAEEARRVDSECRMQDEATRVLLYPPPPAPAPRTTWLAILRSTCAIESESGTNVVPIEVPRRRCSGTLMWGVNCCNRSASSTPKTSPVSNDRAATDMNDAMGRPVLQGEESETERVSNERVQGLATTGAPEPSTCPVRSTILSVVGC